MVQVLWGWQGLQVHNSSVYVLYLLPVRWTEITVFKKAIPPIWGFNNRPSHCEPNMPTSINQFRYSFCTCSIWCVQFLHCLNSSVVLLDIFIIFTCINNLDVSFTIIRNLNTGDTIYKQKWTIQHQYSVCNLVNTQCCYNIEAECLDYMSVVYVVLSQHHVFAKISIMCYTMLSTEIVRYDCARREIGWVVWAKWAENVSKVSPWWSILRLLL